MLPISPESLLRALRLGLAPLVFWQVTKRERKVFEAELAPDDHNKKKVSATTSTSSSSVAPPEKKSHDNDKKRGDVKGGARYHPASSSTTTAANAANAASNNSSRSSVEMARHFAELETPLRRTPQGKVLRHALYFAYCLTRGGWLNFVTDFEAS